MEGQLQMVVGDNMRRLRVHLEMSQESFGEHVGWHRTFVGSVERGERNLTLRTVERLAEQLEVHPLALLYDGQASFAPVVEDEMASPPVTVAAASGANGADPTSEAGRRRPRPDPPGR